MAVTDTVRYRLVTILVIVGLVFFMLVPFLALMMMMKFDYTVQPTEIQDTFEIDNLTGLVIETSSSIFLFSDTATISVSNQGYASQERDLSKQDAHTKLHFRLQPLPGYLDVVLNGDYAVTVTIDGRPVEDNTDIALDKGVYTVGLMRDTFLLASKNVEIEGLGSKHKVVFDLTQYTSQLSVSATPNSAEIRLNGDVIGNGDFLGGVALGNHKLEITKQHYETQTYEFTLQAGEQKIINDIVLRPSPVRVSITTQPSHASLLLNGEFMGESNLSMQLRPEQTYTLVAKKPGFSDRKLLLTPNIGEPIARTINFEQETLSVSVEVRPSGSVYVNGIDRGQSPTTVEVFPDDLLEARSPGRVSQSERITLTKGLKQNLTFTLYEPPDHAYRFATQRKAILSGALEMEKFPALAYTRPGDVESPVNVRVELSRPFYISRTEVTEEAYSQFKGTQSSTSKLPVVDMSWEDAARFCNWLSSQNNLTPVYEFDSAGVLASVNTDSIGFRLPTEAEWETAAGFDWRKRRVFAPYEWGDLNYVVTGFGNLSGEENTGSTFKYLEGYIDNHESIAPVASYDSNFNDIFDLTGNVSEWVHDYYTARREASPGSDYMGPRTGIFHAAKGPNFRTFKLQETRIDFRKSSPMKNDTVGFRIAQWIY